MQIQVPDRDINWLKKNVQRANISEDFDESTLNAIGADVVLMAEADDQSRAEWRSRTEKGMKIAMQVIEEKSFPWIGAANTKDTLIAEAAMQFSARASAEINKGGDIVRTKITGNDETGAKERRGRRVGQYMSYECTDIMTEWEPDTEQLLTSVSIVGMYYKKTYRDELLKRSVSMSISPLQVIVNENARTLDLAERVTHVIPDMSRNMIVERVRSGLWNDILDKLGTEDDDGTLFRFYEQHCWYDLDNDGYKEPYIITVHKDTSAVCRICTRYDEDAIETTKFDGKDAIYKITALQHFTEYPFLYSPDGKFHKVGFAQLLGPITETINTVQNQLLDAGTLANLPPVFVGRGAKLPAGGIKVHPGKMNIIESSGNDLKSNLVIPQLTGPSDVLFKMLGLLKEQSRKMATISDAMQGDLPGANVPATTTLALLDQGLKVFSAILVRLFRSFKSEYSKLYRLDSLYLTDAEYARVVDFTDEDIESFKQQGYDPDDKRWFVKKDFDANDCDVQPVLDPRAASEALRLARLNALVQAGGMPPNIGKIYLKGIGTPDHDIKRIFPDQEPPPNPAIIKLQADIQQMKDQTELKHRELDIKMEEIALKKAKEIDEIALLKSQAMLNIANAEKAEIGTQIETYKAQLREMEMSINALKAAGKDQNGTRTDLSGGSDAGGTGNMAPQQDYPQGDEIPATPAGPSNEGLAAGGIPPTDAGGIWEMDGNNVGQMPADAPHAQPGDVAKAKERTGSMM